MRISDWSSDVCSSDLRNRFPAGSESTACRGQDCEAGAIRTRRIHRYHHGTRPQMKRACLSETHTPVARQVTQGLEAQGWNVRLRTEGPAPDLRVDFLEAASSRLGSTGKADCSSLILRSEEHTSELQSLMRISYAVFCL